MLDLFPVFGLWRRRKENVETLLIRMDLDDGIRDKL
jgi:hypothetical protein